MVILVKEKEKRSATYLSVNFAFEEHCRPVLCRVHRDCQDSVPAASQINTSFVLTPVFGDHHAEPGAPHSDAMLSVSCFEF